MVAQRRDQRAVAAVSAGRYANGAPVPDHEAEMIARAFGFTPATHFDDVMKGLAPSGLETLGHFERRKAREQRRAAMRASIAGIAEELTGPAADDVQARVDRQVRGVELTRQERRRVNGRNARLAALGRTAEVGS